MNIIRKTTKINTEDRVEGNDIIIYKNGCFPKRIVVVGHNCNREYKLIKTKLGKYQLIK